MNRYIKGRITKGEFVSELFKQRVESIGGTYEANDCLVNSLNSLTDKEFKDAKLILTPNGYVVDKLPTIKPNGGGDATVVRNVTKTRVNSSGLIESMAANVLAPDYLNGVCPALNVEGQSTCYTQYSEQFDNAYWDKRATSVTPNNIIDPYGNTNADTVLLDNGKTISQPAGGLFTAADAAVLRSSGFSLNAGDYFYSIFVNKKDLDIIQLRIASSILLGSGAVGVATLNFNTGQLINSANGSVENYINGYYRVTIPFTLTATTTLYAGLWFWNSTSITSDGTQGYHIFGANVTDSKGSYIPTTTAQVTRSADSVTVPIPSGTTEIIEKYEDGTTNTITTIPASPYTVPTGKRYEYILMR